MTADALMIYRWWTGQYVREAWDYGDFILVYESQGGSDSTVNRFVTLLISVAWFGHRYGGVKNFKKVGSSLLVRKDSLSICSMCAELRHRTGILYGLCMGEEECIERLAEIRGYGTLILPWEPRQIRCLKVRRLPTTTKMYECYWRVQRGRLEPS